MTESFDNTLACRCCQLVDGNQSTGLLQYFSKNEGSFYNREATGHQARVGISGDENMKHLAASQ